MSYKSVNQAIESCDRHEPLLVVSGSTIPVILKLPDGVYEVYIALHEGVFSDNSAFNELNIEGHICQIVAAKQPDGQWLIANGD